MRACAGESFGNARLIAAIVGRIGHLIVNLVCRHGF
jgi:hypothetical protein